MYIPMFSAWSHAAFGSRSAVTRPVWKRLYSKQIFAGSFWTHMVYYLENRVRAARFMRLVIRQQDRPLLRAISTQAAKSGARREAIPAILRTGTFIAMPVSISQWNIWVRLRGQAENFPV